MNSVKNREHTLKLVGVAMLSAVVVILQLLGSFIRFGPFSVSLVLIPIVVGAGVYGRGAGTWLGFIFGIVVLLSGDAATFLAINPIGAVVTVLVKGTLAGLFIDLVYGALKKINKYAAVVVSAVVCPVVNTGIFLLGCKLFFIDTIAEWAAAWAVENGTVNNVLTYMIVGLVGGNFIFELLVNVVLSPVVVKLVDVGFSRQIKK